MSAAIRRAAKTRACAPQISTENAPRFYIDWAVDQLHEFEASVDEAFADAPPDPVARRSRVECAVRLWCAKYG
jgi:hypothetical protein